MAPTGPVHGSVDSRLGTRLREFVEAGQLGEVYTNTGFILRREPDLMRGPDHAFVAAERIARQPPPEEGFYEIAPDLVAEVVSPNDTANEIAEKVRDYAQAGVRLIWIVYPRLREVHVYRADRALEIQSEDDALDGEDVLPGFSLRLTRLWS
jgi:Uma2 family endonuclease